MRHSIARKESFPLTNEAIDHASEHISDLLNNATNRRDALRIRLAAEEVMRFWGKALGEDTSCTAAYLSRFGQRSLRLSVSGASADPSICPEDSELEEAGNIILQKLQLAPTFRYEKGVNVVTFAVSRKKPNEIIWICFAAVLALLLGFASLALPEGVRSVLTQDLANPALQMLLGALTGVAMPLVFFSVCISMMDIGDIATLSVIGKKLLLRFLSLTFVASALTVAVILWHFPIAAGGSQGAGGFQTILAMMFDAVPTNIIAPFLDGNTLQLIVLGGCVGVAFVFSGERVRQAASALRQFDHVVGVLMGGINRLIPLFVFFTFFTLAASSTITRLGGALKIVVMVLLLYAGVILIFTAAMSMRFHVSPLLVMRKLGPSFLVSLSTASSMASYPSRLDTCKNKLGIDKHTAHFAVPLAQVLFKPAGCVIYCVAAFCIAEEYGVPITTGWIFLCVVVASLITLATPPIPGGGKIGYTALLVQLGIPAEGVVLILAADAVLDFFITATNNYAQMAITSLCADELGLLDRKVLADT